jgi:predicted metalloendopeptidase
MEDHPVKILWESAVPILPVTVDRILDLEKVYFTNDAYADYVNALRDHIRNLLVLYGRDEQTASSEADRIIEIEREIWTANQDKSAQNDPSAYYKTYTYDQLKACTKTSILT